MKTKMSRLKNNQTKLLEMKKIFETENKAGRFNNRLFIAYKIK